MNMLLKEKEMYPESAAFMGRLIKQFCKLERPAIYYCLLWQY